MITLEEIHAIRDIIDSWLDADGFQEGADGATEVARVLLDGRLVDAWEADGQARAAAQATC